MRTWHEGPANDPHAPAAHAAPAGDARDLEARLDALLHDRRTRRMLSDDHRARHLMLRVARAVRCELRERQAPF